MSFLALFSDEKANNLSAEEAIGDNWTETVPNIIAGVTTNATPSSSNKFPCRYVLFGCKKQLPGGRLEEHEKSCDYKIYECIIPNCSWQGCIIPLQLHIVDEHSNIVLTDGAFKFPTEDLQMLCVIFAYIEIFLVQVRVEALRFFLSVKYVGKPPDCGKYTYNVGIKNSKSKKQNALTLYDGKMKYYADYNSLMEKTDIEFDIESLDTAFNTRDVDCFISISKKPVKNERKSTSKENETENLESKTGNKGGSTSKTETKQKKIDKKDSNKNKEATTPTTVTTTAETVKKGQKGNKEATTSTTVNTTTETAKKGQKGNKQASASNLKEEKLIKVQRTVSEHQASLLRELECPVCQDYMLPPIMLCVLGHSICGSCTSKLMNCPVCTSEFGKTRNYTLESMLNLLQLPCRNDANGCDFLGNLVAIQEHKLSCKYEHVKCLIPGNCKWIGSTDLLSTHLINSHNEIFFELDKAIYYDLSIPGSKYNVIKFSNELCRVSLKPGKQPNGFIYWSFQQVSRTYSSKDYKIEITFLDQTNNGRRFVINDVFRDVTENEAIFNDVLAIPYSLLQPFIDSSKKLQLIYKIY